MARGVVAILALCLATFVFVLLYALGASHNLNDAVGMAAIITILLMVTPYSLMTTGRLPYIDM